MEKCYYVTTSISDLADKSAVMEGLESEILEAGGSVIRRHETINMLYALMNEEAAVGLVRKGYRVEEAPVRTIRALSAAPSQLPE